METLITEPKKIPVDWNQLVDFSYNPFDVLKRAIEYLYNQQNNQAALLASVFQAPSVPERLEWIEQWRNSVDQNNINNQTRMEGYDEYLQKLSAEIKMLKGRKQVTSQEGVAQMPQDQVQDLYDVISDLRNEMVSMQTFDAYKNKSNDQLAEIEVKLSRHQKDIALLMKMPMGGTNSVVERLPTDNSDIMRFIEVLQNQISSLETKAESDAKNTLLVAKLASIESQVTQIASSFNDQDIHRWNQNVAKTSTLEAELNSVKLKLQEINPDHLKQEIKNLNVIMLTFCTKEEHDRLQQEVNKTKTQIIDLDYSINSVAAKLSDQDQKQESHANYMTIELHSIKERLDKLEASLTVVKGNITKIQGVLQNSNKLQEKPVQQGFDNSAIDSIKAQLAIMQAAYDKQLGQLRADLSFKCATADLGTLQTTIMARVSEMIKSLEEMYSDKDGIVKKQNTLEKAMRSLHDMIKALQNAGLSQGADEAMFTKKAVGPVDCASCDRGIVNLSAMRADHNTWNKLPFREPNERIAKYGQGFSRFLQMTDQMSVKTQQPRPVLNDLHPAGARSARDTIDDSTHYTPNNFTSKGRPNSSYLKNLTIQHQPATSIKLKADPSNASTHVFTNEI